MGHRHDSHNHSGECDGHDHSHKSGWRGTLGHIRGHSHEVTVDSWIKVVKILAAMLLNGWLGIWQIARLSREANSAGIFVDGIHNASDMFSLAVPLITVSMAILATLRQMSNESFLPTALTFANYAALAIFMIAAILFAVWRLAFDQVESSGAIMGKAGVVSLIINIASVALLYEREDDEEGAESERKGKDKAMHSAMAHQLSDLLNSIAVIVGSLFVAATSWGGVDPILTICMSVFILWKITDSTREEGLAVLERVKTRHDRKLA